MAKCVYCGNNQTPHALTKFSDTYTIASRPLNGMVAKMGLTKFAFAVADIVLDFFVFLWAMTGMAKWKDGDIIKVRRAQVLWEEAQKRGIKMDALTIFGKPVDLYRAYVGGKKISFSGLPRPQKLISSALFWMDDKAILKEKFKNAGIPVANGGSYSGYNDMVKDFRKLDKPVIVKPRIGSRGRHTTTYIYDEKQLKEAYKIAKQLCHWVVMEEHLIGSVYRGTVIGGKLVGVLGGDPPRITGDGQHTVAELIAGKNQAKHEKVKDVVVNNSMQEFLARNDYFLDTVLPAGKTIDLSEKIGISYGGSSYEMLDETHSEIKRVLEEAAEVVGDPIMGFDFIIADPKAAPSGQKWGIIECNGLPFINLHHDPLYGTPQNVAGHVWDLFEAR
jgi:D-alanine-D-alanine ligase-like ATP-grasp enzyme